jgi:cholesterol transport system auxiliary component
MVLWLLAGVLTGCGSAPPIEPVRYYTLELDSLEAPAPGRSPPIQGSLQVNRVMARGLLSGRPILYRTAESPHEIGLYPRYVWHEPVSHALTSLLTEAIREAGVFEQVLAPQVRAQVDYLLVGEIERYEHLPTAQPPRVHADIDLSLIAARDRHLIWSRTYRVEETIEGRTPEAMAQAFNVLAAHFAREVIGDLRTLQTTNRVLSGHLPQL